MAGTCWTPRFCSNLQTARSGRWPGKTRGGRRAKWHQCSLCHLQARTCLGQSQCPTPLSWCSDTTGLLRVDRTERGAPVPEDWPLQPSLPTPARQGLIATDLLNVHQLCLVDLSDGDVVLGCDRESALGGIWEGVGCDQCPAPVPEAGAPSPSATPVR